MFEWIKMPVVEGLAARQAHADLPPDTFERELSKEGFYGPATHMVHPMPPTGWTALDGPTRPRAFDMTKVQETTVSPWQAPRLFFNAAVDVRYWQFQAGKTPLVRSADGDILLFVHQGEGALFCDYGHLPFEAGDYIYLPRGTLWRMETENPVQILLIEAINESFYLPSKGLLGAHAIFDPAILKRPHLDKVFREQPTPASVQIEVKRLHQVTKITYPYNPLNALGWQGDLYPVKINCRDIRPVMSHRYHIPPSVHTTFASKRFVVCTFCPRPMESDPGALKVPFYHNNDDFDEVIFYHQGEFFSRDNIHPGMITWHPSGITHGPHPKAFAAGAKAVKTMTDEIAVMIDTRDPLQLATLPEGVEWQDYVNSWKVA